MPRVRSVPPYEVTAGDKAVALAEMAGLYLDPWQQLALRDSLGKRPDGKWSSFEVALLVARQNGKGALLEARELAGLFLFGEKLIIHTAHEFKTAQEAFLRIKSLIENTSELRSRVRRIHTSHGEEGIELRNGQRLRFLARSRSSGRGFSGDLVILDEAQELPATAVAAILPTLSARPNPQIWYTGTVPSPENDSEHFKSLRDRGRSALPAKSLTWMEWNPGATWDNLDDREAWAMGNPALGYRMSEETIEREREALGDKEFARERLSIWPDTDSGNIISSRVWLSLTDSESQAVDPVVFAVDVSPDRAVTSVACASRRADGLTHVEIVDRRPGTGWVVDRLIDLRDKWSPEAILIDSAGPAASLLTEAADAGLSVRSTTTREMVQACGAIYDAIMERATIRHPGGAELSTAIANAKTRTLGDAWAWTRKGNADITPLVAVTLAHYGLSSAMDYNVLDSVW